MSGKRTEAPVFALRRNRGILFSGDKAYVVKLKRLQVDSFLDEVAILIADVLEMCIRDRRNSGRRTLGISGVSRCVVRV